MTRLSRRLMKRDARECGEVRDLFSDFADGELDPVHQDRVDDHVSFCPRCRQVLANLRLTLERLGRLSESSPDALDLAEVRERLRRPRGPRADEVARGFAAAPSGRHRWHRGRRPV